jgi:nicotinate-nucleotide pyrophosphorylase (carboxylating)
MRITKSLRLSLAKNLKPAMTLNTEGGAIQRLIETALLEDVGMGDVTSEAVFPVDQQGAAAFLCKEPGVIAGLEVAAMVMAFCDPDVEFRLLCPDGSDVRKGDVAATARGSVRGLLKAERTALNILQRMSGIATLTRQYVKAVQGTGARITDTRKTVPGLRLLDKWAVRLGGGVNHRFGLDDMVLIKDNHIAAAGSLTAAVTRCQTFLVERGLQMKVEVETKTLDEVREALRCTGINRIMLDNFALDAMREAVVLIGRRVEVEASGGITLDTLRHVAGTGVDVISVGALTHSVKALDISLELSAHA